MSDEGRSTLAAAAVIGRRLGFELLAAATSLEVDSLLDVVERAEVGSIVRCEVCLVRDGDHSLTELDDRLDLRSHLWSRFSRQGS